MGSKGTQVVQLQNALNAAGFKLQGKVDGIFGADTLQAVKRFQSVHAKIAEKAIE
jgi:peptidoglycan hydrolase-like protein with peptidoglycan-binding domain